LLSNNVEELVLIVLAERVFPFFLEKKQQQYYDDDSPVNHLLLLCLVNQIITLRIGQSEREYSL